jgi:hypothetical protein
MKSQETEKTVIEIEPNKIKNTQELQVPGEIKNTDSGEQGIRRPTPLLSNDKGVWGDITPPSLDGMVDLKQK